MATYLLITHKLKDFAKWKVGYDADLARRTQAALTQKYLLHDANDPNEIAILFEVGDVAKAKALADSAELKEIMQNLGVIGKPGFSFMHD